MLGGSATTVDTPPMLEAKICANRNGTGSTSSIRQIENVIGTASTTTVTLSRNAEAAAVSADKERAEAVAAGQLSTADGRPVERPGPGGDLRQRHHPGQQQEHLEVHVGEGLVLCEHAQRTIAIAPRTAISTCGMRPLAISR